MKRNTRSTIGSNPLDAVIPAAPAEMPETPPEPVPVPVPEGPEPALEPTANAAAPEEPPAVPEAPPQVSPQKAHAAADAPIKGVTKERLTVHVPLEIVNRVKNAVYWTPGLTLADLASQALLDAVTRLEEERGEAFAQRSSELKGGRPLK